MKGKLRMSPYRRAREELLSGRDATRIQAMADLEAAIRADQRRIDAEQATDAFPLPVRPDGTHFYVSTYCVHSDHAACRLTCLCCGQPCQCSGCEHEATVEGEAVPDLTRDELQDLVDDLGQQAYRAEDVLAFIAEMCDAADADGSPVTTARVRSWLGYTGCGGAIVLPEEQCTICGALVEPLGMVLHFRAEHATAEDLAESTPESTGPFEGAEIGIGEDGTFAWRCGGGQGCEGWVGLGLSSEEAAWSEFRGHVSREHATADNLEP